MYGDYGCDGDCDMVSDSVRTYLDLSARHLATYTPIEVDALSALCALSALLDSDSEEEANVEAEAGGGIGDGIIRIGGDEAFWQRALQSEDGFDFLNSDSDSSTSEECGSPGTVNADSEDDNVDTGDNDEAEVGRGFFNIDGRLYRIGRAADGWFRFFEVNGR